MTTDPATPPRLVFGLTAAERALRRWIDARAGDTGVGAAGAGVLLYLAGHPDALVGNVTAALGGSPSATTGLLNRLATAGLIDKSSDPHDGRAVRLNLTDRGKQTLDPVRDALTTLNDRVTAGFAADELQVINRWLNHVATSLHPDQT